MCTACFCSLHYSTGWVLVWQQAVARPTWVTPGWTPDYRAEWRYMPNYRGRMNRGVFSVENLACLFPGLGDIQIGQQPHGQIWRLAQLNGRANYNPQDGGFDENLLPNGDMPLDPRDVDE
ncbi:hypothetical protein BDV12DRAFT_203393 [Aspergillus spectabilis]